MSKYFFVKKCTKCNENFYRKEIPEDSYLNLLDNSNLLISHSSDGKKTATILSTCSFCAANDNWRCHYCGWHKNPSTVSNCNHCGRKDD